MITMCAYQEVCKHYRGEGGTECQLGPNEHNICKIYTDGETSTTPKKTRKTHKRGEYRPVHEDGVSIDAFRKAKITMARRKADGELNPDQTKALESFEGAHFSTMSNEMKQQLVDMAKG